MNNKHRYLKFGVIVLCVTQAISLCGLAVLWVRSNQKPESYVVINYGNPFIAERADEFDLPQVVMEYDQVINAIEMFYQNKGYYPADLKALTPNYLSGVPSIHIRNGEKLTYSPGPMNPDKKVTPFTFIIYGHYPGLASMTGWYLYYCPAQYDDCNNSGDRHIGMWRINDRWVWINSSAL